MRTDPPTGDELTRLIASMRGEVLRMAMQDPNRPVERARSRTGRRVIAVAAALVGVLVVGGAGAALALGVLPGMQTEPPAPIVSSTLSPTPIDTPTPTPTPSPTAEPAPTPTAVAVDPLDPGTWTIGYDRVADLGLGDSLMEFAAAAGLERVSSPVDCPDGFWRIPPFDGDPLGVSVYLAESETDGKPAVEDPVITYASFRTRETPPAPLAASPATPEGIRLGSSEEELLAAYPGIAQTFSKYDDVSGYTTYSSGPIDGRYLVFQVGTSADGVRAVTSILSSKFDSSFDICD